MPLFVTIIRRRSHVAAAAFGAAAQGPYSFLAGISSGPSIITGDNHENNRSVRVLLRPAAG